MCSGIHVCAGTYTRDPNEVFDFLTSLISQAKRKGIAYSLFSVEIRILYLVASLYLNTYGSEVIIYNSVISNDVVIYTCLDKLLMLCLYFSLVS